MLTRPTLSLSELKKLYRNWDGKDLSELESYLQLCAPQESEDQTSFKNILSDFKTFINSSDGIHEHRYQNRPIFLDAYYRGPTPGFNALNRLIDSYNPIESLSPTVFLKAVFLFIVENPKTTSLIILACFLCMIPMARAQSSSYKCDSATGECDGVQERNEHCNSIQVVGTTPINFKCSSSLKEFKNKKQYRNDVAQAVHAYQDVISKNPAVQCKSEEIGKDFVIEFNAEKEMQPSNVQAIFDHRKGLMKLRSGFTNTEVNRVLLSHELHHHWLWARNKAAGKSRDYNDNGVIVPSLYDINNIDEANAYVNAINQDLEKILALGKIIMDKKYYCVTSTQQIHATWQQYSKGFYKIDAVQRYNPITAHSVSTSNPSVIQDYIDKKYISPDDYTLLQNFSYDLFHQIVDKKFLIYMNVTNSVKEYSSLGLTMHVAYTEETREQTPLLDAIVTTGRALEVAPNNELFYVELDAYLHQFFESTEHMFNYLFSNLRRFHRERYTSEYQECLRRSM